MHRDRHCHRAAVAAIGNYKTIRLKFARAGAFNYNNFRILLCALLHLIIMKIAGKRVQFRCEILDDHKRSPHLLEATPFIMSLFGNVAHHGVQLQWQWKWNGDCDWERVRKEQRSLEWRLERLEMELRLR